MVDIGHIAVAWVVAAVWVVVAWGLSGCGTPDERETLWDTAAPPAGLMMSGRGLRLDLALDDGVVVRCSADLLLNGSHDQVMRLQGQTTLEVDQVFHLTARSDELILDPERQKLTLKGHVRAVFDAPELLGRLHGQHAFQ